MLEAWDARGEIAGWNATAVALPLERTVAELVETQVERTPHAPAVVAGGRSIDYATLNDRANQLAHRLVLHGAGPEVIVALCAEPSIELVVALLAILKAGAAYLPLELEHPARRLERQLADARARLVLARPGLAGRVPDSGVELLALDEVSVGRDARRTPNLAPRTTGDGLAYVLYTSGSTGRPKGVCMPHRPLVNLLAWHRARLSAGARTLQLASLGFDVSFHEVFSALTSGGVVLPAPAALRRDVPALARHVEREGAEKITLPVTVLRLLAAELADDPGPLASLRDVIATGEALAVDQAIARLFAALPGCRLHNHYGPSETHLVTVAPLPRETGGWPARPPIGTPIDNVRCYVLGADLRPLPAGETGELFLGGLALARGYLRRPGTTAERFLPDPFATEPGARMYRSGDLVRRRDDGALEFVGRIDDQVKVGGVRVEPGEVEAQLAAHASVRAAAVVARASNGATRLVGYVVPDPAAPDGVEARLRAFLAERLPAPLVPSELVFVDALPLTANGKLDRAALPVLARRTQPSAELAEQPPSALEHAIAREWCALLSIDDVDPEATFFESGGTSLLLMELRPLLERAAGIPVAMTDLFEYPSVRLLAAHLAARRVSAGTPAGGDGETGGAVEAGERGRDRVRRRSGRRAARRRGADDG